MLVVVVVAVGIKILIPLAQEAQEVVAQEAQGLDYLLHPQADQERLTQAVVVVVQWEMVVALMI